MTSDDNKIITTDTDTFELNVDSKDAIIVERHFAKYTKRDLTIKNLEIPKSPFWLKWTVLTIRFYQKNLSQKLGNRCVFDPSCSHYSELAYRQKGFWIGTKLTISRLHRCRPANGGVDEIM